MSTNDKQRYWSKGEDLCPKCKKITDVMLEEVDGDEVIQAERCTSCDWFVRFDEELTS